MKNRRKWLALMLASLLFLSACNSKDANPSASAPISPAQQPGVTGNLICVEISRFSGYFVEDGKDEKVQNVAAVLVANNTGKYLELATVTYKVGERTATFLVTGLPSGKKVWVLESDRLTLADGDELVLEDCEETYNPNAVLTTQDLAVQRQGNSLTLTNTTDRKLSNVAVYYKNTLEDGTFMGGITYLIAFGDMEPGAAVTKLADHFGENSEIVRYSYQ